MMIVDIDARGYWTDKPERQKVIRGVANATALHGMPVWRVRGIVVTDGVSYCDCESCNGHPGNEEHLNADVIVSCSFKDASAMAADRVLDEDGFWDSEMDRWSDGPLIESVAVIGNTESDIAHFRRMRGY